MRKFKIWMLTGTLLYFATMASAGGKNDKNLTAADDKGFAVVELFTSEGCSSCPPADQLLARIEKESHDRPVYILAYHVHYWNRLGWKDVFSDHAYSERQQQYSRWLKSNEVYTPQAIVNGVKEFIGSEEGTLRNAIKGGLQTMPAAHLQLTAGKADNSHIEVQYHIGAADAASELVLAVVQKTGVTNVKKGENSGRMLAHVQIVRSLKTVALKGKNSGSALLDMPEGLKAGNAEVIAFVQNSGTGNISAAAKLVLNNAEPAGLAAVR